MSDTYDPEGKRKVDTFKLADEAARCLYEDILNRYQVVRDEFAYDKHGEPVITIWYVVEE